MQRAIYWKELAKRQQFYLCNNWVWPRKLRIHSASLSSMNFLKFKDCFEEQLQNGIGNVLLPICLVTNERFLFWPRPQIKKGLAGKYSSFLRLLYQKSKLSWYQCYSEFMRRKVRSDGLSYFLILKKTKLRIWLFEILMGCCFDWWKY